MTLEGVDAKSKEIREKYLKHVARMLELSGESQAQAATDAQFVLTIDTGLANRNGHCGSARSQEPK